jgi:hypothetical protein
MKKWKLLSKKKTPIFGVSLIERMEYEEERYNNFSLVPQLVSNLITIIGEMEPVQGVFRVNGSEKNIKELMLLLDQEKKKINLAKQSIFDLASLLKRYFRDLPDPLLLCENYEEFVHIATVEGDDEKLQLLSHLLKSLPPAHKATAKQLFYLLHHMSTIPEYSMDEKNLALVWGPNLIWSAQRAQIMVDHANLAICFTFMIKNYNDLFATVATPAVSLSPTQSQETYPHYIRKFNMCSEKEENDPENENESDEENEKEIDIAKLLKELSQSIEESNQAELEDIALEEYSA